MGGAETANPLFSADDYLHLRLRKNAFRIGDDHCHRSHLIALVRYYLTKKVTINSMSELNEPDLGCNLLNRQTLMVKIQARQIWDEEFTILVIIG